MKISFERSGGFAGMIISVAIDTDNLSPEIANQIQSWIEQSGFFQLPAHITAASQPDRFHYQVTVTENKRKHTVTVGESAMPSNLKPLMDWLMETARKPR